jgi:hypothetical protein
MTVDDLEITPLSDGSLRVPPTELLNKPAEAWAPHRELLDADGLLRVDWVTRRDDGARRWVPAEERIEVPA